MRSRCVSGFKLRAQLVVQLRKRFGTGLERLILDHVEARQQSARFLVSGGARRLALGCG
jgi:hypothetical protein